MSGFERVECWVNFIIGKPISGLLYGSWLIVQYGIAGTVAGIGWIKGSLQRLQANV